MLPLPQIKFNIPFVKRSPLGLLFLSLFFIFFPKIVFAQLVINEIMYDAPGADDKHEWVEIYNNGSSPVDLTDWKFNDGDTATNHALNAPLKNNSRGTMVMEAGGYALLADDAATLIADLPNYNGTIIDAVLNLSNTGVTLKLLNKDGIEAAAAAYNKDMGATGNGKTLEWDGAALKESFVDGGTPGKINSVLNSGATPSAAPDASPVATGDNAPSTIPAAPNYEYSQNILINEFLPWPEDNAKEWVELINLDNAAINLSGWQIDDEDNSTAPQVIPTNTTVAANGFLVVSFNKNTLNNDGDKVRLLWPDDQTVHSVTYDKSKQGQAVAKFDSGWLWTNQPTPGQANKKSFVEKNEFISPVNASSNTGKITALKDVVAVQTDTPRAIAINNKSITAPAIAPPENNFTADRGMQNPNIAAAAGEQLKSNSGLKSLLALAGVIALSALAAGGLIYFRRQKQFDIESPDD